MDSAINWAVYRQSLPKDLFSIGETGEDCEKPPFDGLEKSFQKNVRPPIGAGSHGRK